jgi:beta-galactosidase
LIGEKRARTVARYGKSNGWLDDQIAISVNSFGKGLVYYVGAYLEEAAQQALLTRVLKTAAVTTIASSPGIEISHRLLSGGEKVYIVINHTATENTLHMPWPVFDHLTKVEFPKELKLAAYGVAVLSPVTE